jgi:hypothetical protein
MVMNNPAAREDRMDARENYIRAAAFQFPEWVPCSMSFSPFTLRRHPEELARVMLSHPRIFPEYDSQTFDYADEMPAVYRQGEMFKTIGAASGQMPLKDLKVRS